MSFVCSLKFLKIYIGKLVSRNVVLEAVVLDVAYHFLKSLGKFLEVLFIKKDLVLIIVR